MTDHFTTATKCQAQGSATSLTRPVFSRSYGRSCGYDDEVATMPLQLFAYASDPVLLLNDATSKCVADDLSLVECTESKAREWIHVFEFGDKNNGGEIFYSGCSEFDQHCHHMMCLTCTPNCTSSAALLEVRPCDARRVDGAQKFEYDGDNGKLLIPGSEKCIISNNSHIEIGPCDDSRARWSQYSECKLNTYIKTKPMKVESRKDPGHCIGIGDQSLARLVNCDSSNTPFWEYYYESNSARLERVGDGNKCLARYTANPRDDSVNNLPENSPNGLTPCCEDLSECTDSDYYNYYSTFLGGDELDNFQMIKRDAKGMEVESYCIEITKTSGIPAKQETCASQEEPLRWRRYNENGRYDATELSVKPERLLTKITDQEALFQIFLFSAGKSQSLSTFA